MLNLQECNYKIPVGKDVPNLSVLLNDPVGTSKNSVEKPPTVLVSVE